MPQKKRIEDIAKGRTNLFSLPWRDCEPAVIDDAGRPVKLNTRQDFGNIAEFAASLADAIREPVLGYMGENGKFQITNGERRWRGVQWLEKHKSVKVLLPCVRESQGYTDTDRNVDLLRTNNGKPLEMIEQAEAMIRLRQGYGGQASMSEKEIAHKAGCSPTHVANCLALLNDAAPEVQEAVRKGEMTGTLAVDLARSVPNKERQTEILEKGREKALETARPRAVRGEGATSPTKKTKVTAKHLSVATGKKAQSAKKAAKKQHDTDAQFWDQSQGKFVIKSPQRSVKSNKAGGKSAGLAMLEELLDAVERKDCEDKARYDTLEFLYDYSAGRQNMANATKFILGMI